MPLTEGQMIALRNLSLKRSGQPVDFINIADARALTELGLAIRSREGWEITREGQALMAAQANDG
jgi:hypothetical protein